MASQTHIHLVMENRAKGVGFATQFSGHGEGFASATTMYLPTREKFLPEIEIVTFPDPSVYRMPKLEVG